MKINILIILILGIGLSSCNDNFHITQALIDSSDEQISIVLVNGAYEFSDGSFAINCNEYLNSPYYENQGNGVYRIDPDQSASLSAFNAQCDMTEDDGGWTLILNYVHRGGTNPVLNIKATNLPLIKSNTLGDDESSDLNSWGHSGNSLTQEFDFNELRFYCETNQHSRIIHFKTSIGLNYIETGVGTFSGVNLSHTLLTGHTAVTPTDSVNHQINHGDQALTRFPFFRSNTRHWGVRALNRWECDNQLVGFSRNTIHRVWIR